LVNDLPVLDERLSPEERELELAFENVRRRKVAHDLTTMSDVFWNELRLY
jgi:hypothetical protein